MPITFKCEHCGQEYVYLVKAVATGMGTNHYFLDEAKAKSRAIGQANYELKQQLRDAHLPVWCPQCGRYQKHMLRILQLRRLAKLALIAAVPLMWVVIKYCFSDAQTASELQLPLWGSVSAILAVVLGIYHFTRDDNAEAKERVERDPTTGGLGMKRTEFEKLREEAAGAAQKKNPDPL